MAAILTAPEVQSEKIAPSSNLLLESLRRGPSVPAEAPATPSRVGAWVRGAILGTFAVAALLLLSVSLMPAVFVTLLLVAFALAPVIVLGLAIVFTHDLQRDMPAAPGEPCSCHRDRV